MSKFCFGCGKELHDTATNCPHCGAKQPGADSPGRTALAVVAWFVGLFGIHRFMVGKKGSGIAQLLLTITIIGLVITAIWVLVDFIMILAGSFTNKDGQQIKHW